MASYGVVGVIAAEGGLVVYVHGDDANAPRPSADVVWWVGSVKPVAMADGDFWDDTSVTGDGLVPSPVGQDDGAVLAVDSDELTWRTDLVASDDIARIETVTQAAYDLLDPPDPTTLYLIVDP